MKNFYLLLSILFFSFNHISAQGETCQTATAIIAGLNVADGPSTGNGCYDCSPGDIGGIPAENADWFTYTPSESGVIEISTCGEGVDTRVWVYIGDCDNLTQIAGSDDACDFAPGEPFAARIENLNVTANTTYFIEFDDAWEGSGFEFDLIFTKVSDNVFIEGFELCFTQIPENQLTGNGIPLNFTVGKQGPSPQSGIMVSTEIFDAANPGTAVRSFNSATFDLPDDPITITSGAIQNLPMGTYFVVQTVFPSGRDEIAADNGATSRAFQVTERTFAVDDNDFIGSLGVPGPGIIRQGQQIYFENPDEVHSVSVNVLGGFLGDTIWAEVYAIDNLTGSPSVLLSSSRKITFGTDDPAWIEIPFDIPFVGESKTTYFFALAHAATGSSIDLGVSEEIFKPRKAWISIDNTPWAPLESINTGDYEFAYGLRVNNKVTEKKLTVSVDMKDESVSPDGVFLQYSIDGNSSSSVLMDDFGNNIWRTSINVPILSTVTYLFQNGPTEVETVPDNCSVELAGDRFRFAEIRFDDVDANTNCFGRCGICPIQGCADSAFILCDDFEKYDLGQLSSQSLFWTTWNADSGDGIVDGGNSSSGRQSLLFDESLPGETQDVLLLLNDVTSGAYEIKWNQLVQTGKSAYFGTMHRNPSDNVAGHGFFFDPGGSGEIWNGNQQTATFSYPENDWFEILIKVDFNNDYSSLSIDGSEVAFMRFSDASDVDGNPLPPLSQLAGINFFPIGEDYKWYVDDVFYREIATMPGGNVCHGSVDLNFLLPIDSVLIDNNGNHTSEFSDPANGFECFGEPDGSASAPEINNSKWYTFNGDGEQYQIFLNRFDDTLRALPGQIALYSGDCRNLIPVDCNDQPGFFTGDFINFESKENTNYYLIVDHDRSNNNPTGGPFRIEINQAVNVSFHLNMKKYLKEGGIIDQDKISLHVNDAGFTYNPMIDNGDSTYSVNVVLPINKSYAYYFQNGSESEPKDSLTNCGTVLKGRTIDVFESDIDLPLVCWGLCEDCPNIVSTENVFSKNKIQLFPNPTNDNLNLQFENTSGQTVDLNIFNQLGQNVFHQKLNGGFLKEAIDVNNWSSGIYIISIRNKKGEFFEKIVVK